MPPKPSAQHLLMDAGEKLFGHCGFDGVSLREIALAAGQSNNAAVHYHFTSKLGLIQAILDSRIAQVEIMRHNFFERSDPQVKIDTEELLKIIWFPIMEIRDELGHYTFCRFLLQHLLHPDTGSHPVAELLESRKRRTPALKVDYPYSVKALELLQKLHSNIPEATFNQRLLALTMMFFASVVRYENAHLKKAAAALPAFNARPILDIALTVLSTPT